MRRTETESSVLICRIKSRITCWHHLESRQGWRKNRCDVPSGQSQAKQTLFCSGLNKDHLKFRCIVRIMWATHKEVIGGDGTVELQFFHAFCVCLSPVVCHLELKWKEGAATQLTD